MYTAITVDDEKLIKRSIAALIETHDTGFTIVGEAKDGFEAIQLNEQFSPDLIITDIRMPKLNGLKFIEKVKETNSRSKFIIISGYDKFEYAQTAIRYGVVDFLLKPIKPEQFLLSLEKVHKQLEANQQASKERSKWLWLIRSFAEDLVKQIWLLEENQVSQMMEDLHEELTNNQLEHESLKKLYLDLIIYIKGELDKKNMDLKELDPYNESNFPDEPLQMKEKLYDIWLAIMEHIKDKRNIGHRKNILSAVKYIEANYTEESLSLQEVANTIDMSPSYFSMEFKAEMGYSFKQFITRMRLETAKELLNNPAYKTYEIAHTIGYSDYPHFTKTFKKHVGVTPSQYRRRVGIQ